MVVYSIMKNHEYEEIVITHNPRGGRPQRLGATILKTMEPQDSLFEVKEISSSQVMRIHLGYCPCGRKVVADENRAIALLEALKGAYLRPPASVSFFRRVRQRL